MTEKYEWTCEGQAGDWIGMLHPDEPLKFWRFDGKRWIEQFADSDAPESED